MDVINEVRRLVDDPRPSWRSLADDLSGTVNIKFGLTWRNVWDLIRGKPAHFHPRLSDVHTIVLRLIWPWSREPVGKHREGA